MGNNNVKANGPNAVPTKVSDYGYYVLIEPMKIPATAIKVNRIKRMITRQAILVQYCLHSIPYFGYLIGFVWK